VVVDGREQRGRGAVQREEVVSEVQHRGGTAGSGGGAALGMHEGFFFFCGTCTEVPTKAEAFDARVGWALMHPGAYCLWANGSRQMHEGPALRTKVGANGPPVETDPTFNPACDNSKGPRWE
jgi:hypothetical protein